jgi:hypothetical protein
LLTSLYWNCPDRITKISTLGCACQAKTQKFRSSPDKERAQGGSGREKMAFQGTEPADVSVK